MEDTILSSVVLFFNTTLITISIIAFAWFVLQGIGLFKIAKENNIRNAWLAWIPFAQNFVLGEIVGNKIWNINGTSWILLLGELLIVLIPLFIPLNLLTLILLTVFYFIYYLYYQSALNILYQEQDQDKSVLYFILGFIFPFLIPIWIFVLRNKKEPYYKNYNKQ